MATIRDHVRGNFGETYRILTSVGNYDGRDSKPDVVGDKIDVVVSRYVPDTVEDPNEELSEFTKSVVADIATRLLIPVAIDYYMVETRRTDNASRPAGVTPLGGEVGENYDRVDTLFRLDELLRTRIAEAWTEFITAVGGGSASTFGIRTSTERSDTLITEDPLDFERIRGPLPQYIGYGVAAAYTVAP